MQPNPTASPTPPGPSAGAPLGLRDQFGATFAAAKRLLRAHVDLGKAEAGEIAGEVGKLVALIGVALGLLFVTAILLLVGLALYLSDWLLGSMGWGVLLGTFLLLDLALVTVLAAVGVPRGRQGLAFVIGVVLGVALGAVLLILTGLPGTVSVALGIWLWLLAWPIAAGVGVARGGIDGEALKRRFYPDQTIELTKETIEWVRARTPLVPKS